jgi:hypothetical protein
MLIFWAAHKNETSTLVPVIHIWNGSTIIEHKEKNAPLKKKDTAKFITSLYEYTHTFWLNHLKKHSGLSL